MSNMTQDEAVQARQQWEILCAKHGQPEAAGIKASGLNYQGADAHNARKSMRRAINAITAKLNPGDYSNEVTMALSHAAKVVAEINSGFDHLERQAETQTATVLRNSADFARHYKTDPGGLSGAAWGGGADDGEIGIADFLRGVANLRTTPAVQNALSVGTDSSGGFSVPSRLMPGILSALVPVSSLMQAGAGIVLLEDGAKTYTTAAVDTIPTAAWRSEAGALADSEPAFRAVVATPRSLAFKFKISRELLADGQGIQQALYQAIGQAFAKELDRVGLRGTGSAPQPRGILNTSGIQAVANGTDGASLASTKYANMFTAMQAILEDDAPMPTAAIMSPRSLVTLGGLADSTGQPLDVPKMLQGIRQIGTSQIPDDLSVGASDDCSEIYIGDFTKFYWAMRESVSVQMLHELYAGTGEVGFACHMRVDAVLTYPAAFAVVTGVRP